MRLYCKLLVLIALTVMIQRYMLDGPRLSSMWFAIRCHYAYATNDNRLINRLIAEECHRTYHPDEYFVASAD